MSKYINPFTDFGFKKIFGEEANKELLIDFMNEVLAGENHIVKLTYKPTEKLGGGIYERKAIYDLYCENERGEKFIIEIQKAKQNYFKERSVFYSTFPIREQGKIGDWDFNLVAVYTIGILDFRFNDSDKNKVKVTVKLKDDEDCIFYNKLTFIYLQLVNFNKTEDELETNFDKWLFLLRHLSVLEEAPARFRNKIFKRLFTVAEIAKLSPDDYAAYFASWKAYNDNQNVMNYQKQESFEEGIKTGEKRKELQIARFLLQKGVSIEVISESTGLTDAEINEL